MKREVYHAECDTEINLFLQLPLDVLRSLQIRQVVEFDKEKNSLANANVDWGQSNPLPPTRADFVTIAKLTH